jgi:DNA polymerase I
MKVRGIDLRRSDVPDISRKMQRELLGILSDCKSISEIGEVSEKLYHIRDRYISKIRRMGKEDFILNLKPTRRLEDYRVENIQKAAIRSMRISGMDENPGQRMEVVIKDGKRHIIAENPEDIPDYKFYEKYIHRAFEPFQYIISYAKAGKTITLENWIE